MGKLRKILNESRDQNVYSQRRLSSNSGFIKVTSHYYLKKYLVRRIKRND